MDKSVTSKTKPVTDSVSEDDVSAKKEIQRLSILVMLISFYFNLDALFFFLEIKHHSFSVSACVIAAISLGSFFFLILVLRRRILECNRKWITTL